MRRLFVTNLLFVIAVNALVKPIYVLGVDRAVQNQVGPASFGMYQALVNLALIFTVLLDFGLANYNIRMVAAAPDQLPQRMGALLTARVLLSVTFCTVVFGAALLLGYRGPSLGLLGGVLLIQCLSQAHLFFRSCLSGLHKFKADSLLSVADRLLMIGLCAFLLRFPQFSLRWFIGAQIGCYAVALLIGMRLVRHFSAVRFRFTWRLQPVWAAMRESLPYALISFLMAFYLRLDAMLIERLSGAEEAGKYAAAYRLLDVGQMFGLTFASMLLPLFGRLHAEKKSVRPLVETSANLLLPVSFIVAGVGLFYAQPIMTLFYPAHGPAEAPIFTLLMLAFPAFCLTHVYSTLLTATGQLRKMNQIAAVACVVSLMANLFFIRRYQSVGGGWATLVTQWMVSSAYAVWASRTSGLVFRPKWLGSMVLYALLVVIIGYGTTFLPLPWPVRLAILCLISGILLFPMRFISIGGLKQVFARQGG